jgi:hypothetical protein
VQNYKQTLENSISRKISGPKIWSGKYLIKHNTELYIFIQVTKHYKNNAMKVRNHSSNAKQVTQHEFHTLQFNFNVLSTKNTSANKSLLMTLSVHTMHNYWLILYTLQKEFKTSTDKKKSVHQLACWTFKITDFWGNLGKVYNGYSILVISLK